MSALDMLSVDARRAILADVALEQLLRANACARRLALAAASRRGVVAVIAAQRLTGRRCVARAGRARGR